MNLMCNSSSQWAASECPRSWPSHSPAGSSALSGSAPLAAQPAVALVAAAHSTCLFGSNFRIVVGMFTYLDVQVNSLETDKIRKAGRIR